jgi:hypothetical protein
LPGLDEERLIMKKTLLAIVSVSAVIAVAAGLLLLTGRSTAQDMDLEGASAEELAELGVVLEQPGEGDQAVIDSAAAASAAKARFDSGAEAREVVLARLHGGSGEVKDGQLVWVVNMDPNTISPLPRLGPGSFGSDDSSDAGDAKAVFSLVYVDAETGDILGGLERAYDAGSRD